MRSLSINGALGNQSIFVFLLINISIYVFIWKIAAGLYTNIAIEKYNDVERRENRGAFVASLFS
jgi:hypothetical protein